MVMGVIILKKKYSLDKYISVGMITAGISLCTIVSSQDVVSVSKYNITVMNLSINYVILFKLKEKNCCTRYCTRHIRTRRLLLVVLRYVFIIFNILLR